MVEGSSAVDTAMVTGEPVPVEIGIAGEDDFEVLEGLTEGQTVVTGPFRILRELKDGAQVDTDDKGRRGRGSADD